MAMLIEDVRALLGAQFLPKEVEITDTMGNGDYYNITVTSTKFKGLNKIAQHKMVYKCLGEAAGRAIHSVTVNTKIKEE